MPTHQETNAYALKALIEHMQGPKVETTQIRYRQAGPFALIGKGHSTADIDKMDQQKWRHEGIMMLKILKNNQMHFFIDGDAFYGKDKQGRQKTETNTLNNAVQDALARVHALGGTQWNPIFEWAS